MDDIHCYRDKGTSIKLLGGRSMFFFLEKWHEIYTYKILKREFDSVVLKWNIYKFEKIIPIFHVQKKYDRIFVSGRKKSVSRDKITPTKS